MIDWLGLGVACLWVVGLALVLFALSHASWQGRRQRARLRAVWTPHHSVLVDVGLLSVVLAMALRAHFWWQAVIAVACCAALAWQTALDVRRARGMARDPVASAAPAVDASPGRNVFRRAAACAQAMELPVVLVLLVPLVFLPQYAARALGVALVFWGIRWVALGPPTRPTPADAAMVVLLFQAGLSVWVTTAHDLTWVALNQFLAGVFVLYAVVNWVDRPGRFSAAFALALLVAVALAMVPLVARVDWSDEKFLRVPESMLDVQPVVPESVNANVLAGNLVLVVPLALVGMSSAPWYPLKRVARWLAQAAALGVSAVCLATLVLTQSRGALVALAVGLAVFFVLRFRWARYVFMALVVLGCVWAAIIGPAAIYGRVATPYVMDIAARRLELWSRAIYAAQDFPFTGIGLGTFVKVIPLLYPYFLHGPEAQVGHAHNLLLQVAADLGLPGLVAYVACLVAGIVAAWRLRRLRTPPGWQTVGAAFLAAYTVLLVHGLVDAVTWGTKPAFVQWMIAGLVFAAANLTPRQATAGRGFDARE